MKLSNQDLGQSFVNVLPAYITRNYSNYKSIQKEKDLIDDIHLIGSTVHRDKTISIDESITEMTGKWSIHMYLGRYYNIRLDPVNKKHDFFMIKKVKIPQVSHEINKICLSTKIFDLYKAK